MENIKLFVPLGTQKFSFDRIVNELNNLVLQGRYSANEIVMQSMSYNVKPSFIAHEIIPLDTFNRYMDNAEIIIIHAGVNSIMSSMQRGKPLIIVPRMKEFGEHVDNHQLEIAHLMENKYNVLVAYDIKDLEHLIAIAPTHTYRKFVSNRNELIATIKHIVDTI